MTSLPVTDTDIFVGLRKHLEPARLSQLIVDITNKSMEDADFRDSIIKRLGITVEPPTSTVGRDYNLTLDNLKKVYPTVNPDAIDIILKLAPEYGIVAKKHMASFIATCIVESKGFNAKRESFNYRPDRLVAVFPTRVANLAKARELISKGQVYLANYLYGGRYGNRPGTNDGWDYRGGGVIGNTFRDNYYILQNMTGIPFGDNPTLIEDLEKAVKAAMEFWRLHNLSEMSEKINTYSNGYTLNTLTSKGAETKDYKMNYGARLVRQTVNGGLNGYKDFCETLEKALRYL